MTVAEKKRKGCLFYGCLISIILGLIVMVGVPLAIYFGVNAALGKFVENYTDLEPIDLPTVEMAEADLTMLRERVETFREAIKNNESSLPLELTSEEINALIFHDAQLQKLKGKAFLEFEENALKGQISIPLSDLKIDSDEPRYINGSGTFKISVQEGKLSVVIQSIELKGKKLPESIRAVIQGKNLFENAQLDPEAQKLMRRLKKLEVREGKLVLELNEEPPAEIEGNTDFEGSNAL